MRLMRSLAVAVIAVGLAVGIARSDDEENQPLKNVLVLKGKTRKEIVQIMKTYTNGLGVKCSFCHEKDYASDAKAEKKTAREMIKMVDELNAKYSIIEKKANCYLCHRGSKDVAFGP